MPDGTLRHCATCRHLGDPANPEHAAHYRACHYPLRLPVLMADRLLLLRDPANWVTRKAVEEKPELIGECVVWEGRGG